MHNFICSNHCLRNVVQFEDLHGSRNVVQFEDLHGSRMMISSIPLCAAVAHLSRIVH